MKRRDFIGSAAAIGLLGLSGKIFASPLSSLMDEPVPSTKRRKGFDEDLVVFISDLHTYPDGYQPDKLRKVVADIVGMRPKPRNVIALGDLAYLTGRPEEYALMKEILAPIEAAGITLTLAMGNHDRRENFAAAFPEHASRTLVPGRFVEIVKTQYADIIVLDSLQQGEDETTWITPGKLDEAQLAWLKETLSNYSKPVFVTSHHPIGELGIQKVLLECPSCFGYIHGHDHRWRKDWIKLNYSNKRLVPTLCLPSTGHWGDIGYTCFRIYEDKAVAELNQYEFFFPKPAENPSSIPAQWKLITEDHQGAVCSFAMVQDQT